MNKISKKIVYLVNTDSFFISHRIRIADQLKKNGYEIHIATEFTNYKNLLKKKGFITHDIRFNKNSLNILLALVPLLQIMFLLFKVKPNILLLISLKPSIFGGLISFISPVKNIVISITGLGSMFLSKNLFGKFRENIFNLLLRIIFLHNKLIVILQNKSDEKYLLKKTNLRKEKVKIIRGSGVDLNKFKFSKLPKKNINIVMISRIIADKGIREYIDSIKYLKKKNLIANFYLVGNIDFSNPSAIKKPELELWKKKKIIKYFTHKKDVFSILKKSSIIVLPSYREGFPKVLMEAAAVGRPSITTNVPGCKDAVINNKTGILVPPKNHIKLAKAIKDLSLDKRKLKKISVLARKHAVKNFNIINIVYQHILIYQFLDQ